MRQVFPQNSEVEIDQEFKRKNMKRTEPGSLLFY